MFDKLKGSVQMLDIFSLDIFSKEGIAISDRQSIWTMESLKSVFCYYDWVSSDFLVISDEFREFCLSPCEA